MFDSHVAVLLEQAVSLVNALTDGEARGRPYATPDAADLPEVIDAAVGRFAASLPRDIDAAQADYMVGTARRMREVFRAMQDGEPDVAARAVNALLRDTAARPRLDRAAGGGWQVHFHGPDDSFAAGCGAGCATALALAVGGGLAGRLGVCRADRCDRVYVDTSRNAARQYCSTACQNRTKAAAFRARNA
ncbi:MULTISPECIES: CGNR zinc finger domain-containing protein [unclassified Streptomyces]|uniref:CGNR zinc finger domain-containing protein n=1 Tax=unclassified Streptomyces TaxID=2593676 RepID=UPI00109E4008|nr:CGNR zinc finger domain-containing protein [Streptomyces sp. A1136]THA58828.1 CGNR zinc finger domain-containing protein [Streptomyces sp. A1136]